MDNMLILMLELILTAEERISEEPWRLLRPELHAVSYITQTATRQRYTQNIFTDVICLIIHTCQNHEQIQLRHKVFVSPPGQTQAVVLSCSGSQFG